MARRKQPMRRCVGCGTGRPKGSMMRVVRTPDGEIVIDTTGKTPGRGAYVCPRESCAEGLFQKRRLSKALRLDVNEETREEIFTQLMQVISGQQGGAMRR